MRVLSGPIGLAAMRIAAAGSASVLTAGVVLFAGPGAATAQTPDCFGAPATIEVVAGVPAVGTEGNDVIIGSAGPDTIDGRGGNDLICGLGGDDVLMGGLGNDQIDGGDGNDTFRGDSFNPSGDASGGGNDRLFGRDGDDLIIGDSLAVNGDVSGGGRDEIYGGNGNDRLTGDSRTGGISGGTATGGGNDLLDGGDGNDSMVGDSSSATADATGAGNDVLLGGSGIDAAVGDSQAPGNAIGSGGNDILDLGADGGFIAIGDHNIFDPEGGTGIGAGNDQIIGGSMGASRNEELIGDSSVPDGTTNTSAGHDVIIANAGDDRLFGDNAGFDADFNTTGSVGTAGGNDVLDGGEGVDTLRAGPRNDSLDGGDGAPDDCDGEAGTDTATRCEVVNNVP